MAKGKDGYLVLDDGSVYEGTAFGCPRSTVGEVVFNTGMVGYPETLTDPSYRGQILTFTFPLIGNYGVPIPRLDAGVPAGFESDRIQTAGVIVSEVSLDYDHWTARTSLAQWLCEHRVPGLSGIDTRRLTKHLRHHGTMRGSIVVDGHEPEDADTGDDHLVSLVSVEKPVTYPGGEARVVVVDCGCKNSIIRSLLRRGVTVIRVPWDYNFLHEEFDGVLVSNGPGDPTQCGPTIAHVREAMERDIPVFGICLGHQIMALAAGFDTYKLKFGHRSQNQPCIESGSRRCYITSQNHGYAVDAGSLPSGWEPWFVNANDGTNEGLRHTSRPFRSVQFHPEAAPGPTDTNHLFDVMIETLRCRTSLARF